MHTNRRRMHGALASLLLVMSLATRLQAAGVTVSAGAAPLTVKKSEVVAVPITISGVDGLYGFEAQLRFDPAVVRVSDADPAKAGVQMQPGDFLSTDFLVRNTADNAAGTAEFVLTQLNPSEAKSGSGTLFTVYFEGIAEGKTSTIRFNRFKLSSRDGVEIPAATVEGEIKVAPAASSPAAASETPLPTAAPPVLDMDALTATPWPTVVATAPEPATATLAPEAPAPVTAGVTPAAARQETATQALAAAAAATPTLGSTPVAQSATEQPETVSLETPSMATPAATREHMAVVTGAPIISGTPQHPADAAAPEAAPAPTGLLFAGGGLLVLACAGIACVIVLRNRSRRS